ncbi:MAG: disulfide bond formation protein B [Rhodobacteraceae bacterium]|nr:disulfide bond formation protein B [Paracoccaceae bacterium]
MLAAISGSVVLLVAALGFQYLANLPPCPLCIWQRWAHVFAVVFGALALAIGWRLLPVAALLAMLAGCGIAFYHVGVEQGMFEGLEGCAGESLSGQTAVDLLDLSKAVPVAACNEVAWSFVGVSMAGWNGMLSVVLAAMWGLAIVAHGRGRRLGAGG